MWLAFFLTYAAAIDIKMHTNTVKGYRNENFYFELYARQVIQWFGQYIKVDMLIDQALFSLFSTLLLM